MPPGSARAAVSWALRARACVWGSGSAWAAPWASCVGGRWRGAASSAADRVGAGAGAGAGWPADRAGGGLFPLGPPPSIPLEVHGGRRAALQRPVPLRVKMQGRALDREVDVASLMGGFGAGRVTRERGTRVRLCGAVFDTEVRRDVVHRSVVAASWNRREPRRTAKQRHDYRNKKPFKQKGNGMARQGTTRGPHQKGGAKAHGPQGVENLKRKVNKKERSMALCSALSARLAEGNLVVVDSFKLNPLALNAGEDGVGSVAELLKRGRRKLAQHLVKGKEGSESTRRNRLTAALRALGAGHSVLIVGCGAPVIPEDYALLDRLRAPHENDGFDDIRKFESSGDEPHLRVKMRRVDLLSPTSILREQKLVISRAALGVLHRKLQPRWVEAMEVMRDGRNAHRTAAMKFATKLAHRSLGRGRRSRDDRGQLSSIVQ